MDAAELRARYRPPAQRSLDKEIDHLDENCAAFIRLCPLVVLATADGASRADTSPRGGPPGFVAVLDAHRLALPDLAGNNRLDSFTNICAHPGVSLLCVIPGLDETLRVVGRGLLSSDPEVLARCPVGDLTPRVALVVEVETAFVHCAKALRRAGIWRPETWAAPEALPDPARMLRDHAALDCSVEERRQVLEEGYAATTWQVGGEPPPA